MTDLATTAADTADPDRAFLHSCAADAAAAQRASEPPPGPMSTHVYDFDARTFYWVTKVAKQYGIETDDLISQALGRTVRALCRLLQHGIVPIPPCFVPERTGRVPFVSVAVMLPADIGAFVAELAARSDERAAETGGYLLQHSRAITELVAEVIDAIEAIPTGSAPFTDKITHTIRAALRGRKVSVASDGAADASCHLPRPVIAALEEAIRDQASATLALAYDAALAVTATLVDSPEPHGTKWRYLLAAAADCLQDEPTEAVTLALRPEEAHSLAIMIRAFCSDDDKLSDAAALGAPVAALALLDVDAMMRDEERRRADARFDRVADRLASDAGAEPHDVDCVEIEISESVASFELAALQSAFRRRGVELTPSAILKLIADVVPNHEEAVATAVMLAERAKRDLESTRTFVVACKRDGFIDHVRDAAVTDLHQTVDRGLVIESLFLALIGLQRGKGDSAQT